MGDTEGAERVWGAGLERRTHTQKIPKHSGGKVGENARAGRALGEGLVVHTSRRVSKQGGGASERLHTATANVGLVAHACKKPGENRY